MARIGSWEWDIQEDVVVWSPELYGIYGLTPGDFVPTYEGFLVTLPPGDAEIVRDAVRGALEDGRSFVIDSRIPLPDGSFRSLRGRGEVVRDRAGTPIRLVGTVQDVSELTAATEGLRREHRFITAAFDNLNELVLACDTRGNVTAFNRAMADFIGVSRGYQGQAEWAEKRRLFHPNGSPMTPEENPLLRCLRGEEVHELEIAVTPRGGRLHTMIVSAQRLTDSLGTLFGAVITARDVTEQRKAEARLEHAATHDALTGLPNRSLFIDRTTQALRRCRRQRRSAALLSVDIDRFGDLNIRLGPDGADLILVEVARRLERAVRSYDSVTRTRGTAARVGGDEFLLLCEGVGDASIAVAIATRVSAAIAEPIELDGNRLTVTASMGITLSDGDADAGALIGQADAAMRRAKEGGPGSREFFDQSMRDLLAWRADLERDLRTAIERDELRLQFQPKVAVVSQRIVGVEALVRWQHPERGRVPPNEFIPIAENTDLIVSIGRWVLEESCRQAQKWRAEFPDKPLLVSVNVSARQFDTDLVGMVRSALAQTGMNPDWLCLEVTEGIVMRDVASAVETLRALKALGVKLSIDDFGTGYSSLAYLRRFPLDELKVDKSFVDGLGTDPDATAIVAAVIATAHALSLTVVAEGVETGVQLAALRTLGCELVQGYYFFRPQSAATVSQCLAEDGEWREAPGQGGSADGALTTDRSSPVAVVVDDAADVRRLAQMSLAASGFEVHEAETGEAALTMIAGLRPDCVILDLNLPGMSGLEVCRQLRADPSSGDITVVMLTGDGAAKDKALAFALGADEYIVKPFAPRDLVARVQSAMRQRREARSKAALPAAAS